MKLDELKEKFKNKPSAGVEDIQVALEATPFLVREVIKLEKEIVEYERRIEHLSSQIKKRPPLSKKGTRGEAVWQTVVDEQKNRLNIVFQGVFDFKCAKMASNSIVVVMPNLRENFDILLDFRAVQSGIDRRFLFHLKKVIYQLKQVGINRIAFLNNPNLPDVSSILGNGVDGTSDKVFKFENSKEANSFLNRNMADFLKT